MKPATLLAFGGLILWSASGCGASPAAPAAPTAPAATTPSGPAASTNLTGTWTGTGTDAQGPETFTWTIAQSGSALSGTALMQPANTTDGTCGSCHKQKAGTLTGTMSGTVLTLTLAFPDGGNDLTPLCGITMTATTSNMTPSRIVAAYTGSTTCEGPITDGALVMAR